MYSCTNDPNDSGVVDQMLSAIYETETFNHHANGYAMKVVHHYFGFFDDEWFNGWILCEEFRDGMLPGNTPVHENQLRRYEKMHDMYWNARAEWFNIMIGNINAQNLREQHRMMHMHTLTSTMSWEEYSEAAQRPENHVTHLMEEDE